MRQLDPEVTERDYARRPLTADEVRAILAVVPPAEALNTRHALVKERGWKARPPSVDELVAAALEEPNVLRRPITLRGGRAVVGGDEDALRELLG